MPRPFVSFVAGLVVGAGLLALILGSQAPGMMLIEDDSTMDFDATVATIIETAEQAGWKVPAVHTLSKSVAAAGFDVRPATVIELCNAELAGRILSDEDGRGIAPMMPCRVAVFERADGGVTVSRMDSGLMSRVFGGIVQEVMSEAASENEDLLNPVIR